MLGHGHHSLLRTPAAVLQVQEAYTELARSGEEMDILRIMLDTAEQQVREAKRKALNFELMAATTAVMASPLPPARAAGEGEQHEGPDATDREADQLMQGLGITLPSLSRNSSMAAGDAGGSWAAATGHAVPGPISTAAAAAGAESVPMTPTSTVTPTASRGRYLDALVGSSKKQGPEAVASSSASWLQVGQGFAQQRPAAPEAAAGPGSGWSGSGDHQVRSQLAPYAGEIQLGKPPAASSRGNSASNADLQKQFQQLEQLWASQLQQQQQQQPLGRNRRSGSLAGALPALPEASSSRGGSPVMGQAASRPGSRRGSPDVGRPGQQQQQRRQDQQQGQKGTASSSSPRLATPRGGAAAAKAASGDHSQQQQQEEEVGTREVDQVVKELYFSDDEVDQEPSSSPGETAVGHVTDDGM